MLLSEVYVIFTQRNPHTVTEEFSQMRTQESLCFRFQKEGYLKIFNLNENPGNEKLYILMEVQNYLSHFQNQVLEKEVIKPHEFHPATFSSVVDIPLFRMNRDAWTFGVPNHSACDLASPRMDHINIFLDGRHYHMPLQHNLNMLEGNCENRFFSTKSMPNT